MNRTISRIEITIQAIDTDGKTIAAARNIMSAAELRNENPMETVTFGVKRSLMEILKFLKANTP